MCLLCGILALDNNNNFGEKYGDGSACFTQPIPVRRFSAARGRSAGCYQVYKNTQISVVVAKGLCLGLCLYTIQLICNQL